MAHVTEPTNTSYGEIAATKPKAEEDKSKRYTSPTMGTNPKSAIFSYACRYVAMQKIHLVRRQLYQARMIHYNECGIGGMRSGRRNRSTPRKPSLVPLRPPHTPDDPTWARTRVAAFGNQYLTVRKELTHGD